MIGTCLYCDTSFEYNPHHQRGKYCNNVCQNKHKRQLYITEWLQGSVSGGNTFRVSNHVRHYLLEQSGYKCSKCGWSGKNIHTGLVALEIDHKDDDPFNHSHDNLQVLCPNCHSMKTLPPSKSKGGRGRLAQG